MTMDAQFWDDRYRSRDQLFSGVPNGVLVTEVTGLVPGRALDAVAPGGTLLIGSHDLAELPAGEEHGFNPSDYYQPDDIARLLDHDWTVLINETRPRTAPAPAGTHHIHDTVLRAQRGR